MTFIVVVGYPNKPGARFDADYYGQTHMPRVSQLWGPRGLRSWAVIKPLDPEYLVQAVLTWESQEAWRAAGESPEKEEIFGDVPNYTNAEPVLTKGDVTASWSA